MKGKEIIFVASGKIEIPPNGYGAVEDIIWNYKTFLEMDGYKVKIVNTKNILTVIKNTVFVKDKIIHFHYEPYLIVSYILNKLFFRNNMLLWTCHNGYLINHKETKAFKLIAKIISLFQRLTMISLSLPMQEYFEKKGFGGKKYILQNGIDTEKFKKISVPRKEIIYLGSVDKNKGQDLFLKYSTLQNNVDFVGPYADKGIDLCRNNYLGVWTKKEIFEKLGEYKLLILLTAGEGDPMVVKEALAAGCSILTSNAGGVNIIESDFIKIIDITNTTDLKNIDIYVKKMLGNNIKNREEIWNYSQRFDWKNIISEYKKILNTL